MPPLLIESRHNDYELSTDPDRVCVDQVYDFLANHGYWSLGRSRELVETSITNTDLLCAAYAPDGSVAGFARMITDFAIFAYLCDVYVAPEYRGAGLGVALVTTIVEHPDVANVKRQMLATRDAHELYAKLGYEPLEDPTKWMERRAR